MPGTHKRKTLIKKIIFYSSAAILVAAIILVAVFASQRYNPKKYNRSSLSVSGGAPQENANLSGLNIVPGNEPESVDIVLSFSSGSEVDGNLTDCGIPEYCVSFLSSPMRLNISLKSLTYWDYVISGTPSDASGLVIGSFRANLSESNETLLCFNLSSDVTFKVTENGSSLTISLLPKATDSENTGWYILCDLFYEYQEGSMPESDFTPTLCNDNISVIMISNMFKTEQLAQNQMDALLVGSFEGINMRLVALDRFTLPQYAENTDATALLSESVLSVDGAKTSLPLLFADARFLCWLPDNSGALFAKAEESGEMLYIADKSGTKHQLISESFSTVVTTAYSSDGKYLSFVDQTDDVNLVTIVELETGAISVIGSGEEGQILGNMIIGLAMNDDGSKLYCLSGDQIYSLKAYDIKTKEIEILATNIIVESDLKYNNGYLYYCDVVDEVESVVRISAKDPSKRDVIYKGSQFSLSSDGSLVAVITEDYDTAVCDLNLVSVNTEDHECETVLHDIVSGDFFISSDNKYVFYVLETGDEEFYYQIMRYDRETDETSVMAQSINGVFFASDRPNEIIISVIYSENGMTHPVTYLADFDAIALNTQEEFYN